MELVHFMGTYRREKMDIDDRKFLAEGSGKK